MIQKELLCKIWDSMICLLTTYLVAKIMMGKGKITDIVLLCVIIIIFLFDQYFQYKAYKIYLEKAEYVEWIYKTRNKLYITGEKEEVEEYSADLEKWGTILIYLGERFIQDKAFKEEKLRKIQDIIYETKKMMTE